MGNPTQIERKDPNGELKQTQSQVFDPLSRLTQQIGAQNQTTQLGYDGKHNQTGQTDALNRQSGMAFDALDQLIQHTDAEQGETSYGLTPAAIAPVSPTPWV